ncbi:MAG: four helix bundle protein [Myxococcaceae bacterium]
MQDYKELEVWRRAHKVVLTIYSQTRSFPSDERFGVTSQLRRAAMSIPTNLAEGCRRAFGREYSQYVNVAQGSRSEVQYLVQLAADLGYLDRKTASELYSELEEIGRMLHRLRESINRTASLQPSR